MKTMTKREQIEQYNLDNPGYHITDIKSMTAGQIEGYRKWGAKSLDEKYARPSYAKRMSYERLLQQYMPREIISVQGSSHAYSVLLRADNGDLLHITHANNYLVKEV